MANTKISALTAATALVGTEAVPVVQTGATVQTTAADLLRQSAESVAVSTPRLNLTQSWTTTTTKTLDVMNVAADPGPSNAASLLIDRQYLSVSKFSVSRAGNVIASGLFGNSANNAVDTSASAGSQIAFIANGTAAFRVIANRAALPAANIAGWSSTSDPAAALDTGLSRSAAAVLAVGNGSAGDTSGTVAAKNLRSVGSTVAALTAAATAGAGARAWVTDATQTFTAANFGTTVTGGGANGVPVTSDGTNWKIG